MGTTEAPKSAIDMGKLGAQGIEGEEEGMEGDEEGIEGEEAADAREAVAPDMYTRWVLDVVIELAYAVSQDFVNRPQFYQNVDRHTACSLRNLLMFYGTAPSYPNAQQRQAMHVPLFGKSDAQRPDGPSSPFHTTRKKLIDACVAFSERVFSTGEDMLKDREIG